MNTYNNFITIYGREFRVYGNTFPMYLATFAVWFKKLNEAFRFTPAKQAIDGTGIALKLKTLEDITYIVGSPFASNQTYDNYERITNTNSAESAFKYYRSDIEGYFNILSMQLALFEAAAKNTVAEIAPQIQSFEARKANIDAVIASVTGEAYEKAVQEKQTYQAIQDLLGEGRASIELYAWAMAKTYEYFNPTPMQVNIVSTQTVEVAKSETKPEEVVTVSTVATDSTNKAVSTSELPKTQTGEIATTKAIDEATGNVVEIVTDKQSLPVTKTATVENTSTGETRKQDLALNAQGQPVATVVTDSTGTPKTMIDPVSKQEMPVVNTASLPVAVQQAVASPQSVARVETDGTPVATANTTNPTDTRTPAQKRKENLTKAGVVLGVCTVFAVIGYSILK